MKGYRIRWILSTIAAVLLALAAVIVFYDFTAHIRCHYPEAAATLLRRALLLLALLAALLALITLNIFSAQREKMRRVAIDRGRYYLLSHFANTYLFEFSFETGKLTLSGNLPPEVADLPLGVPFDPHRFQTLIHPEDYPRVLALYEQPPAGGEEREYEFRLRHLDGSSIWYGGKAVAIYENRRPILLMGRFENIDMRKHREAALITRSNLDALTGLLNRRAAALRIREFLHSPCALHGGALLMLDLDNFKTINDTCGHASGDHALLLTAHILRDAFRSSDIIARAGGDEFLIFLTGICQAEQVTQKAEALCRSMAEAATADGLPLTCSVGGALYPIDGKDFDALFRAADAAMYRAKRQGKNAFHLYTSMDDAEGGAL